EAPATLSTSRRPKNGSASAAPAAVSLPEALGVPNARSAPAATRSAAPEAVDRLRSLGLRVTGSPIVREYNVYRGGSWRDPQGRIPRSDTFSPRRDWLSDRLGVMQRTPPLTEAVQKYAARQDQLRKATQ